MAYKQIKGFDLAKMGKQKGWCLQNCRLGFGITTGHYSSAKEDMQAQRKAGTLHDISTLPTNVAVPIYLDTASQYEHVIVSDHGTFYSDGVKVASWKQFGNAFGWGEYCDGQRVVEWTADPQPTTGFLPARGYWCLGDKDARVAKLADFMVATFPAYTSKLAKGSLYGKYLRASIVQFQKRTGLVADGCVGKITYAKLQSYGFKG